MSNAMPPAPAGWYPDPDGQQRYWDGQQWLDIPAPRQSQASAASRERPAGRRRLWMWIAAGVTVLLIVVAVVAAVTVNAQRVAVEEAAASEAAAEAEQTRVAEASHAAEAEEAARAAEDERLAQVAEVAARRAAIREVQNSITALANEHAADGVIDGPVTATTCTPVDGYTIEDLDQPSAVLECFVSTEDLGDGRFRGYDYNATVNWVTSEYNYGLGAP